MPLPHEAVLPPLQARDQRLLRTLGRLQLALYLQCITRRNGMMILLVQMRAEETMRFLCFARLVPASPLLSLCLLLFHPSYLPLPPLLSRGE
jgi:hypothetical protein